MPAAPEPRTLLILVVLSAVAAVTTFLAFSERDDEAADRDPQLQLAYYLKDAELTGTAADGTVLYTVRTKNAQQNVRTRSVELEGITMEYGGATGLPWNVRANGGRIPNSTNVIELQGNVVVVSGPNHPNPATIRTERLDINPETLEANTDRRVTLTFADRRLNATGMRADFETNNLQLLSNVHGKFNP